MRTTPKESEIQKACIDWLNTIPGVKVWRQNTGAFAMPATERHQRRFLRFSQKGAADISGIGPEGVRIEIEVKRQGNKPTPAQWEWLEMIDAGGGIAFCADSLRDCCLALMLAFDKKRWPWNKNWEI